MELLNQLRTYARFSAGLRHYFRYKVTPTQAAEIIRRRLENRGESFLLLARRSIYDQGRGPYYSLLRAAGCDYADLAHHVLTDGLEPTLTRLRAEGVYVTFAEFKGREPLVRGGKTLATSAGDYDNPILAKHFVSESGGSTGQATRVSHDIDHHMALAPYYSIGFAAHGVQDCPMGLWRGVLPDASGINNHLHASPSRRVPERWFSHMPWGKSLRYDLATGVFVVAARLTGMPVAWPEYVPLDQGIRIARWIADTLRRHGRCFVAAQVSRALRIALAAEEAGLDLTGAVFMVAGEPPTPAKLRAMERVGVRCFPTYGMSESGRMAMGCANPVDVNDLHFHRDAFALITHPEPVPGTDVTVPGFNVTALLPTAPKLMINVVSGDYGIIEERACGCPLEHAGLTTHLREIRSIQKLTGEGVSLIGTDMLAILEEFLPARFGGSPLDYQLLEEEDDQGFTRLYLVVSPRVQLVDESAVIPAVLERLRTSSPSASAAELVWARADIFRVRRAEPVWTARGKFMPLHLSRHTPPPPTT